MKKKITRNSFNSYINFFYLNNENGNELFRNIQDEIEYLLIKLMKNVLKKNKCK
jgi:hypothetical protein